MSEVIVAIDPEGRAWTAILESGQTTLYRDPPEAARSILRFEE